MEQTAGRLPQNGFNLMKKYSYSARKISVTKKKKGTSIEGNLDPKHTFLRGKDKASLVSLIGQLPFNA